MDGLKKKKDWSRLSSVGDQDVFFSPIRTSSPRSCDVQLLKSLWKLQRNRFVNAKYPRSPIVSQYGNSLSSECQLTNENSQQPLQYYDTKLGTKSPFDQELIAIQSLVAIWSGVSTETISCTVDEIGDYRWTIDNVYEARIRTIINKCLPLAKYRDIVFRFISKMQNDRRQGLVCKALAVPMAKLDKAFLRGLSFYEKRAKMRTEERMSLDELHAKITMDFQSSLENTADICGKIDKDNLVGGEILDLLNREREEAVGDGWLRLLNRYFDAAMKPYLNCLDYWILFSHVQDPAGDFMIRDWNEWNQVCKVDGYHVDMTGEMGYNTALDSFDQRFKLVPELCPEFLRPAFGDIFKCGKYLHIIKKCGAQLRFKRSMKGLRDWKCSDGFDKLVDSIELSCLEASKMLLQQIFLKTYKLIDFYSSLGRVFLTTRSDWLSLFLHVADDLLEKPYENIDETSLSTRLDVAMQNSSMKWDKFRYNFIPSLEASTLTDYLSFVSNIKEPPSQFSATDSRGCPLDSAQSSQQSSTNVTNYNNNNYKTDKNGRIFNENLPRLTGFDVFCMDLKVPDQLRVIFDAKSIVQYQIVFRRLFAMHRMVNWLARNWRRRSKSVGKRENLLRNKMQIFSKHYLAYCSLSVIRPKWIAFQKQMKEADSIEVLLKHQSDFLSEVNKSCMLTDAGLIVSIGRLLDLIMDFVLERPMMEKMDEIDEKFQNAVKDLLEKMRKLGTDPSNRNNGWENFAIQILSLTDLKSV